MWYLNLICVVAHGIGAPNICLMSEGPRNINDSSSYRSFLLPKFDTEEKCKAAGKAILDNYKGAYKYIVECKK